MVKLLKKIKSLLHNQLQNDFHAGVTAYESLRELFRERQARYEKIAEYHKRFTSATEVLDHVGVTFPAMLQDIADDILKTLYKKTRAAAKDENEIETELRAGKSVLAITSIKKACPLR